MFRASAVTGGDRSSRVPGQSTWNRESDGIRALIAELRRGDPVIVENEDGWFVYRFRNLSYVLPAATDVLLPVPQRPEAVPTHPVLTMTSCHPMYSAAERIVALSVFDEFVPRRDGTPDELVAG